MPLRVRLLTIVLLCEFAGAQPLPDTELVDYIERRVESGEYVGMIVGYFDETGSYIQSFGGISKGSEIAPDERTIFEISSVSKTFAATLLADAVVRAEMSLDDAVNDYLKPGARLASFSGRDIRLVDLAAHQSGLPNVPTTFTPNDSINPLAEFDQEDLMRAINTFEPESAPGSGHIYSAFAYGVLARALGNAFDMSFEELVKRRITKPLAMSDTVAMLDTKQKARLAVGYTPDGEIAEPLDQGALRAAGSMYSTLADLMIWVRLHAEKPSSPLGQAAGLTQVMQNDTQTIGLAWHRTEGHDDRSQYGTANGYRAYVGLLADGSKGAAILANTQANVPEIGNRLLLGDDLPPPTGAGSAQPHLSRAADGTIVLSWLEPVIDGHALRFSTLTNNSQWGPARTVTEGSNWFVNWADFPSVRPVTEDFWAAHWLAKRPGGTYAYDIAVALSLDGGQTWSAPITPHTDDTRTEHGFVSLFPWKVGVGALWLDGRETTAEGHAAHGDAEGGGMTLRSAVLTPGQKITDGRLVDDLICDCCQTDVAVTDEGPVAVYRNRTRDEIRDIYITRSVDGEWQAGAAVANDGWEINGCPVNGPAVVASGMHVAVAWFTAPDEAARVRVAHSADGGQSFSTPVDVDVERPIGRVDIELLDGGHAVVSWLRNGKAGHGNIVVRTVAADGELGSTHTIATTGAARSSGFPQMMRQGNELVFAWTDTSADQSQVLSKRISIASLIERD